MWMLKPNKMLEMFNFVESEGLPMTQHMGGWAGAGMIMIGCLFSAAAQLDTASKKKLLQYHRYV